MPGFLGSSCGGVLRFLGFPQQENDFAMGGTVRNNSSCPAGSLKAINASSDPGIPAGGFP